MKYRSSIFSFKTLKVSPSRQGLLCLCLCLCLVITTEISSRMLLHRGRLELDMSLQKNIEDNLLTLSNKKPLVWLIGNSTLGFIDDDVFNKTWGATFIKITHGGATVSGSGAMLDYYLQHAVARPEHVFVYMTKDDVNANGKNAATSERYLEFMTWKRYVHWNYSRLRATRGTIYRKIMRVWSALFVPRENRDEWFKKNLSLIRFISDPKKIAMLMMRDYYYDDRGFSLIADVCRKHGVLHISIVLLPVSDSYAQWHDRLYPQMPYNKIRNKISMLCTQHDIRFIDLGDPIPAQYFGDFFHLNQAGSNYMQRLLTKALSNHSM